eukprot:3048999-Rhodomonas_salina.1
MIGDACQQQIHGFTRTHLPHKRWHALGRDAGQAQCATACVAAACVQHTPCHYRTSHSTRVGTYPHTLCAYRTVHSRLVAASHRRRYRTLHSRTALCEYQTLHIKRVGRQHETRCQCRTSHSVRVGGQQADRRRRSSECRAGRTSGLGRTSEEVGCCTPHGSTTRV